MHLRVEHLSSRSELTCIVLNATVRNVINDFTLTAKGDGHYSPVHITRQRINARSSLSKNVTFFQTLRASCRLPHKKLKIQR